MVVTAIRSRGQVTSPDDLVGIWKQRIAAAKKDRARFVPNWQQCLAFAAGKHHLEWSRYDRKLVLPDSARSEANYSEDVITERKLTAAGQLGSDDDRPQIRFREADLRDRDYADQANRALAYAWDEEIRANELLADLRLLLVDLGTAAVQCRWDPTVGPVRDDTPHHQGQPIHDINHAADLVSQGQRLTFPELHEGRLRWRVLSPFQLLPPPGVVRERDFPWEIIVSAYDVDKLREEYGSKASGLKGSDLLPLEMLGTGEITGFPDSEGGAPKLENCTLVYECYSRPGKDFPNGRTLVLAGDQLDVLDVKDELPYEAPDGTKRSGITYFHYWRLSNRFWGQGIVEKAKPIQRRINKRRAQTGKIIDRGLPAIFAEEGSIPEREGEPVEVIAVKKGSAAPNFFPGIGPPNWMDTDMQISLDQLGRATCVREVSLGEQPVGQNTYSGIALLRDSDQVKIRETRRGYSRGLVRITEDSIYDIRRYWGPEKQIAIAGQEEGMVEASVFNSELMPSWYMIELGTGGSKPRSEADELAKIDSIATYSINSRQPLPTEWYAVSLEQGKAEPIPEQQGAVSVHEDKARLENSRLLSGQHVAPPADYDPITVHVTIHREAQIEAEMAGLPQQAAAIAEHIQQHEIVQQRGMLEQAQMAAGGANGVPQLAPQAPTLTPGPPQPGSPIGVLAGLLGQGGGAPPGPGGLPAPPPVPAGPEPAPGPDLSAGPAGPPGPPAA